MYGEGYTKEQEDWILENAELGIFKNQKHFTDVFNAIWGTNHTVAGMNNHLFRKGIVIKTDHHKRGCSEEQKKWLVENFKRYGMDFVSMANDFNREFGTDKSNCCIAKYCERTLGLYKPVSKKHMQNAGMFKKGNAGVSTDQQLPVGTIRTKLSNHVRIPVVKVKLSDGDSGMIRGSGHNYKKPWWIPLKEKIWAETYGDIPDGYCVVCLDNNQMNCGQSNLALLDKRGIAIMASHEWWMSDKMLTQSAITWCNLYLTAKDAGIK